MSVKSIASLGGAVAVIALLLFGLLSDGSQTVSLGDPAPDKDLAVLGSETETGRIADYQGKWVLVNFWASWCKPCEAEAPELESFWRQNRNRGVVVLGINLDDNTPDAQEFVERNGLTYPQLRDADGEERRDAYGMTGFPESFLVDPKGNLALIRRGVVDGQLLDGPVTDLIRGS